MTKSDAKIENVTSATLAQRDTAGAALRFAVRVCYNRSPFITATGRLSHYAAAVTRPRTAVGTVGTFAHWGTRGRRIDAITGGGAARVDMATPRPHPCRVRSEERRVGKE